MELIIDLPALAQSEQARALAAALVASQPPPLAQAFAAEGGKDAAGNKPAVTMRVRRPNVAGAQGGKDTPV